MAEPVAYHEREQAIPAGKDRAVMREQMFDKAGGAMGFEVKARRVFRHGPTATMVRQLLFWEGRKCADPEGYVYITYPQWWDEEGLTRTNVDTARFKLKDAGVLEEDRRGVFNRLHYRLKLGRLMEVMFPELDPPTENDPVPENEATLNQDFTVQGSDSLECRVPTVQSAGMRPSHNRDHAESTSKEVSPLSPPRGADEEKEGKPSAGRSPDATSSSLHQPTPPREKQAGQERVKDRPRRQRNRSRGGTPEAGIEALRNYKNPRYGYNDLECAVPVAEKHDFTQDAEPHWSVMKELGNDRILLKRVRRVVQGAVRQAQLVGLPGTETDASPPDGPTRAADSTSLPSTPETVPPTAEGNVEAARKPKGIDPLADMLAKTEDEGLRRFIERQMRFQQKKAKQKEAVLDAEPIEEF